MGIESVRGRILPFSYLQAVVVNTAASDMLSRTAPKLSQIIAQILDTMRFKPPFHLRLIGMPVVDLLFRVSWIFYG